MSIYKSAFHDKQPKALYDNAPGSLTPTEGLESGRRRLGF